MILLNLGADVQKCLQFIRPLGGKQLHVRYLNGGGGGGGGGATIHWLWCLTPAATFIDMAATFIDMDYR